MSNIFYNYIFDQYEFIIINILFGEDILFLTNKCTIKYKCTLWRTMHSTLISAKFVMVSSLNDGKFYKIGCC